MRLSIFASEDVCIAPVNVRLAASTYTLWVQACTEWFARLRLSLLKLAAALGHHTATAHHGQRHLATLQKHIQASTCPRTKRTFVIACRKGLCGQIAQCRHMASEFRFFCRSWSPQVRLPSSPKPVRPSQTQRSRQATVQTCAVRRPAVQQSKGMQSRPRGSSTRAL